MLAALKRFTARVRAMFRKADADQDFAQELESHVEMLTADNIARGMSPDEARRAARIRSAPPRRSRCSIATRAACRPSRTCSRTALRRAVDREGTLVLGRGDCRHRARDRRQHGRLHDHQCGVLPRLRLRRGGSASGHLVAAGNGRRQRRPPGSGRLARRRPGPSPASPDMSLGAINISDDHAMPEQTQGSSVTAQFLRRAAAAAADWPGFSAGDEQRGAEPVVVIGYDHLDEPLRPRPERARPHAPRQRQARDDHRRDARADEVS